MDSPTPQTVRTALDGDQDAMEQLYRALVPVIHARVARALLRWSRPGRGIRQEVEDSVQDVFVELYKNRGRVLRAWEPRRGNLSNFVGLISMQCVARRLRRLKSNPWRERPVDPQDMDHLDRVHSNPEQQVLSRQQLGRLLLVLRSELSSLGLQMFDMLWVKELQVSEICAQTGMTPEAVYAWRSRLKRKAAALLDRDAEPIEVRRDR